MKKTKEVTPTEDTQQVQDPENEVKPRRIKSLLQYKFTDEEINNLAKQLAYENNSLEQFKSEKKAVVSEFDNKIKVCETSIMSLSGKIGNGSEYRNVDCLIYLNQPTVGKKRMVRTDTGEESIESMNSEEMQEKIFDEEEIF